MGRILKRFIIVLIFFVGAFFITLPRPYKIDEENVVTNNELMTYRDCVISVSKKYGYNLTEEEIEEQVQHFKEIKINIEKSKAENIDIKREFKIYLIIWAIFIALGLLGYFYRSELYGNPFDKF